MTVQELKQQYKTVIEFPKLYFAGGVYKSFAYKDYRSFKLWGLVRTSTKDIEVDYIDTMMDTYYFFVERYEKGKLVRTSERIMVGTKYSKAKKAFDIFKEYLCDIRDLPIVLENYYDKYGKHCPLPDPNDDIELAIGRIKVAASKLGFGLKRAELFRIDNLINYGFKQIDTAIASNLGTYYR